MKIVLLILSLTFSYFSVSEAAEVKDIEVNRHLSEARLEDLSQTDLRENLRSRLDSISNIERNRLQANTHFFLLPKDISKRIPGSSILEIGCSSGASVRAFSSAASVSVVEPDINALALGFDREWTSQMYGKQIEMINNNSMYIHRMNLDATWLENLDSEEPWISDSIHIYPCTLEKLPPAVDKSFDMVVYKGFNIPKDHLDDFFKRLSAIVKEGGVGLIEFYTDDYKLYNKENISGKKDSLKALMLDFFETVVLTTTPSCYERLTIGDLLAIDRGILKTSADKFFKKIRDNKTVYVEITQQELSELVTNTLASHNVVLYKNSRLVPGKKNYREIIHLSTNIWRMMPEEVHFVTLKNPKNSF